MANATDPLLSGQWFLSTIGFDKLNGEFNGKGVTVGVYDDGVEKTHEDLAANYDASLEFKLGGVSLAPNVGPSVHGTAVAGLIAGVAGNGIGGAGISSGVKFAGVDMFGNAGGSNTIAAMQHMSKFDTVNHSWGWTDTFVDGLTTSFGKSFIGAIKTAADTGRGGLGTIVVNAAGNEFNDDHRSVNTSEFSADRHTITVGAIGQNGDVAYYSNRGSSLLVSAPSNGGGAGLTTTDMTGSAGYGATNYTSTFGGTSGAAPIVTATTNLMLDASRGALGWRDVQDILAITADHTGPVAPSMTTHVSGQMAYGWQTNGATNVDGGGMHYSNDVGYGQIDAFEAVRFAEIWKNFGPAQTSANEVSASVSGVVGKTIADNATTTFGFNVAQAVVMEHVDLTLTLTHANVKELRVEMISPDGTKSVLMDAMTGTAQGGANWTWTFGSDALRGVLSTGDWSVRVTDTKTGNVGTVASYKLDIYGDAPTTNDVYHYTDDFAKMLGLSTSRSVLADMDGGTDWINLAAMTKDTTANLATSGGFLSIEGNRVTIQGVIENVVTGDGNDTLTGNEVANRLLGMRGNDVLEGKGGDDILDGGTGIDTARFTGKAADYVVSRGIDADGSWTQLVDRFAGRDGTDKLYNIEKLAFSDATMDALTFQTIPSSPIPPVSNPGSTFTMTAKVDTFLGTAKDDVFKFTTAGLGGSDKIDGGAGIDTLDLSGVSASTRVFVQLNTSDSFSVGASYGTAKNIENIIGSAGNDTIYGNALDNRIEGGAGNDILRGYGGKDVFVFGKASGQDSIYDFVQGEDRLDFGAGMDLAHLSVRASGANLVVSDADSFVTLIGGGNLHLTNADFFF